MSALAYAPPPPSALPVAAPSFSTAVCRKVWDYYCAARGPRPLLPHGELAPVALADVLPNLLLYELQDADVHRVRLCGTAYRGWFGADLTGRNWLDFASAEDRLPRQRRLARAALQPCGLLTRVWQFRDRLPRRKFESVTLPLAPRREGGAAVMLIAMADLAGTAEAGAIDTLDRSELRRIDWSFVDLGSGVPDPAGW